MRKLDSLDEVLIKFGEKIRAGELVAFPTETVYGIGANALDPIAVSKIFTVKGRPANNPLIVHVSSIERIQDIAEIPGELSKQIFEKFSPGPITVLLPKKNNIPSIVTAGSSLVGVRIPSHPTAQKFLKYAGVPIAAPSANKSGKPSATHSQEVIAAFGNELPNVIAGGQASIGVESTVVLPVEGNKIVILRQGAISLEQLQEAFPEVLVSIANKGDEVHSPSPGVLYRHYAPKGKITILENGTFESIVAQAKMYYEKFAKGQNAVVICSDEISNLLPTIINKISLGSLNNPESIMKHLYTALNECDAQNYTNILVQSYDETGIGRTLMERIRRAAE